MDINIKSLLISAQRALLGKVPKNLRVLTIGWQETKLQIIAYFESEPHEDHVELINEFSTEVLADFPEFTREEIMIRVSLEKIPKLEKLNYWIFLRHEV